MKIWWMVSADNSKQISLINAEFDLNAQAVQLTGGRDDLISKVVSSGDYYGGDRIQNDRLGSDQFSIGYITEVTIIMTPWRSSKWRLLVALDLTMVFERI